MSAYDMAVSLIIFTAYPAIPEIHPVFRNFFEWLGTSYTILVIYPLLIFLGLLLIYYGWFSKWVRGFTYVLAASRVPVFFYHFYLIKILFIDV